MLLTRLSRRGTGNLPVILGLLWLGLAGFVGAASGGEKFEVVRVGGLVYSNVTVLSVTKTDLFLQHAGGIANFKLRDLDPEVLQELGCEVPSAAEPQGKAPSRQSGAKTSTRPAKNAAEPAGVDGKSATKPSRKPPQPKPTAPPSEEAPPGVKALAEGDSEAPAGIEATLKDPRIQALQEQWKAKMQSGVPPLPQFPTAVIAGVLGALLACHLFFCYCCKLIVRKTANEAGFLIWLPVLQLFPLLRAAGMSGWWFILWMLPGLNLLASIVWCFKIVSARGKGVVWAILLLLPFTNLIAFLYLAFSDGDDESSASTARPLARAA
jgi:hypothetical protein